MDSSDLGAPAISGNHTVCEDPPWSDQEIITASDPTGVASLHFSSAWPW